YGEGLRGDSARKSMQAMVGGVTDRGWYQAFHHFITHAPWDSAAVWHRLLAVLPERRGLLILDDTPFLKQGTHSVGVARQYASTVKKVTNCQVAVTAALWSGGRAGLGGGELYLPAEWLGSGRRAEARIPPTCRFPGKGRLAPPLGARGGEGGSALTGGGGGGGGGARGGRSLGGGGVGFGGGGPPPRPPAWSGLWGSAARGMCLLPRPRAG